MNDKITALITVFGLPLLISISIFLSLGCNCSKFNTFILDRGISHFSFEYPSYYEINMISAENNLTHKYTYITMTGPRNSLLKKWEASTSILIMISLVSIDQPNVKTAVDRDISSNVTVPDFVLISRTPTSIAGMEGEEAIYSFTASDSIRGLSYPKVRREIFFEGNGLLYEMIIVSSPLNVESDNIDFDHILNTFRVLP